MNFNFKLDTSAMQKEFQESIDSNARTALRNEIKAAFREPYRHWPGDKGGYLYQMIKDQIDDKFTQDETQRIGQEYIDKHWDEIYKAALHTAMTKAATHLANQQAFKQAGIKNPRELENNFDPLKD